jgi:hypothetical protein
MCLICDGILRQDDPLSAFMFPFSIYFVLVLYDLTCFLNCVLMEVKCFEK